MPHLCLSLFRCNCSDVCLKWCCMHTICSNNLISNSMIDFFFFSLTSWSYSHQLKGFLNRWCSLLKKGLCSTLPCPWQRNWLDFRRSGSLTGDFLLFFWLFLRFFLQPTFLTQWWTIFQQISALGYTMDGPALVMGMSTRWWWVLAGTLTTKISRSPWFVQEKHHSLQTVFGVFSLKGNVNIANPFIRFQIVLRTQGMVVIVITCH